ncbi:DOMON domain-containing protein [Parerythrobacter jejuensis]|uniref:DOMON-like domain-containing protein n=1 Tax=Parerythrobacter jejuensis TaxID=795812 RepID=A0A845B014_9SPHN|nr:hypothetical protein [Parerythrobacter jejuensis]MXP32328.1 hypothetical protein [Parerythrobacter jejuensis]
MHELVLHPSCEPGPITSVSASIQATPHGCRAKFRFSGDVGRIKVPMPAQSERMDNLWKTTCFEIFWQPQGGTYYREFNLSPSSRWACYDFDDFRLNSRDAPVDAIAIACSQHDAKLELEASIASALPLPAQVALNAIVEDMEGNIQFWALAFADGKPEFHSTTCRALTLEPIT